jgi:spore maturation protein CgeB
MAFYARQRFTLNLTRAEMRRRGFSPSVRLFEAAACETAIISDAWPGLAELFRPEEQIIIAGSTREVVQRVEATSDAELARMGRRAREQVLLAHSSACRAAELETYLNAVAARTPWSLPRRTQLDPPSAATARGTP